MLLLPLLVVLARVASAQPANLSVGVFECITGYIPPQDQFAGEWNGTDFTSQQSVSVQFLIAAKHFNARRSDILPVLGEAWVQSCPTKITIPRICDTTCFVPRVVGDLKTFAGQYDALAGFSSSTDLVSAAPVAKEIYGLPIVDHWSSSPELEDRDLYPNLLRTGQDDGTYAVGVTEFLLALNYTRAVLLYVNYDSGPAFKDALYALCFDAGIDLVSFQYNDGDPVSVMTQVELAKKTEYNVIMYYGYAHNYLSNATGNLPGAAAALNMTGNQLWLFLNYDTAATPEDLESNANISALFHGALRLTTTIPVLEHARFDYYMELWRNGSFDAYRNDFNKQLPPFGTGFTSCADDELPYQLAPTFFEDAEVYSFEVWAYAYDTIMTLGLAACSLNTTNVSWNSMVDAMYTLDFEGLSGRIVFDPTLGGRRPELQTFVLQNWKRFDNGSYVFQQVGTYVIAEGVNYSQGTWDIASDEVQFPFGDGLSNRPLPITPPPENRQYLLPELRVLGYVEIALVQLLCAWCAVWLYMHRTKRVVVQSQPVFMRLILVGCAVSSWSILGLVVDDAPDSFGDPTKACNAAFSIFPLGYVLAIVTLAGKTYRVWSVFHTSTLHVGVSVARVLQLIALAMSFTGALVLAFQLGGPAQWVRTAQITNVFGFPLQSIGQCLPLTQASQALVSLLFITVFLACVAALALASAVRKAPEEFLEARYTTMALTVILQVIVVGAPVVFATYSSSVAGRFVIMSFIVFFCNVALIGFIFFPKMRRAARKVVLITNQGRGERGKFDLDVVQGLRIPRVKAKFEKFAAEQLVLENLHFLCDVDQFRAGFDHSTAEARKRDAVALVHMYIDAGSMLEVNISDSIKQAVAENIKREPLEVTLFDEAAEQVAQMTNFGAWGDFVDQGGLYGMEFDQASKGTVVAGSFPGSNNDAGSSGKFGSSFFRGSQSRDALAPSARTTHASKEDLSVSSIA